MYSSNSHTRGGQPMILSLMFSPFTISTPMNTRLTVAQDDVAINLQPAIAVRPAILQRDGNRHANDEEKRAKDDIDKRHPAGPELAMQIIPMMQPPRRSLCAIVIVHKDHREHDDASKDIDRHDTAGFSAATGREARFGVPLADDLSVQNRFSYSDYFTASASITR